MEVLEVADDAIISDIIW